MNNTINTTALANIPTGTVAKTVEKDLIEAVLAASQYIKSIY